MLGAARDLISTRFGKYLLIGVLVILLLIVIWIFTLATIKENGHSAVPLVIVKLDNDEGIQSFKDAGLELVQVDQIKGEVILAMYPDARDFITSNDYEHEVLVKDMFPTEASGKKFNIISLGGERENYRTWDDYVDELLSIEARYPDIARLHIIGHTHWGLPLYALEVCNALGINDGRPESFHEAQMHAQEWPSGEMAIELAWYLTGNYGRDDRVTNIVESIRTWIMPVSNPDGVIYRHYSGEYWRKNRLDSGDGAFGVDLARNFSYEWGLSGSTDPDHRREYHGPYAYSEPEVAAYGDFLLSRDCITVQIGHTPGEMIYRQDPIEEDYDLYMGMINRISQMNNYIPVPISGAIQGGSPGYHVYEVLRGLSICLEYGKEAITPYKGYPAPGLKTDVFDMFNGNFIWNTELPEEVEARLIDCGSGSFDEFPSGIEGNIALMKWEEGATLDLLYLNASLLGAAGAVFYHDNDGFMRRATIFGDMDIPALILKGEDGRKLSDCLAEGGVINAKIVSEVWKQDSMLELWERNKDVLLYIIEEAAVHSSIIEGTVTNSANGEPVKARIDKKVVLTAPLVGPYDGEYIEHIHHTFIETDGSFKWHVLPGKQPLLDTPPYEITVTAPGFYDQTLTLAVNSYNEKHQLNFALQPRP